MKILSVVFLAILFVEVTNTCNPDKVRRIMLNYAAGITKLFFFILINFGRKWVTLD